MKHAFLLLLIPLLAFAALPEEDFLGWRIFHFQGASYDFALSKAAFQKAPKWNPEESDFPPLSPKQAQLAAFAQLKTLLPDKHPRMRVSMIALEAIYDSDWLYLVTFDYSPLSFYSGPPMQLTVPVYFDGSTITPRIRKDK